ncbi:Ion-translocating oxidoreductase complex subunit B [Moorella thermoacetica]|uniref:FAD-dependent oxidoreductase n=1 Tax=Neomoorella thermoacetica TaxID=1525 RepID=UPI0030D5073D
MSGKLDVLVVGGGPAGMAAALDLARAGLQVMIVEKEAVLGGRWLDYGCKAGEDCSRCNICLGFPLLEEVTSRENITLVTGMVVVGVTGTTGAFTASLRATGPRIDWQKCDHCGRCREACPAGAILPPHPRGLPRAYRLDHSCCLRAKEDCQACVAACPRAAIELEPASPESIRARAIVVATGFAPFDAAGLPEYGYGFYPRVTTAMELESALSQGDLDAPGWERLSFIQCAGSRSRKLGHDYCSRVCCGYTLRLARALKYRGLSREITIFYMDLQLNDARLQELYRELRATPGLKLVRGMPSEIRRGRDGRVSIHYEDLSTGTLATEEFDRVVLAVGITPVRGEILPGLSLERDPAGFLAAVDGPNGIQASTPGVFLAGTCQAPRDIQESITHGRLAAAGVRKLLEGSGEKAGMSDISSGAGRSAAADVLVSGRGASALLAARDLMRAGLRVLLLDDDGDFDPADPAGELAGPLWSELTDNSKVTYLPGREILGVNGDAGSFSVQVGDGRRVANLQVRAILLANRLAAGLPAGIATGAVPILTQQQLAAKLAAGGRIPALTSQGVTGTADGDLLAGIRGGGEVVFWLDAAGDLSLAIHALAWQNIAALKERLEPDRTIYVLARQVRVAALPELEALYGRLREAGVIFIKPQEVPSWDGACLEVSDPTRLTPGMPEVTRLHPDLLVVGEELAATPVTRRLWQRLGLKAVQGEANGPAGMDSLYYRAVTTNRRGIFLVAAGREPVPAGEAGTAASLAAAAVVSFLKGEEPEAAPVTLAFRPLDGACAACLTCVRTCPHGAMVVQGKALVRTRSCQGCGICVAECPAHALELPEYTDVRLLQAAAGDKGGN